MPLKKSKVFKEKNPLFYFYSFKDGKMITREWQIIIFG